RQAGATGALTPPTCTDAKLSVPRRTIGSVSALDGFSPATRNWFRGAFAAPTPAQEGAWSAAQAGRHALVVAPTGSGKTLAAFLWALDRLASGPPPARCARHHARVAVPAAHLGCAGVAAGRHHRDPRRGARGRGHEARRPPGPLAGAARRAVGAARAAHRPVGHRPAARWGVHVPRGRPPGRGGAAAH